MPYAVSPDGMYISEDAIFLTYNPNETAHAIELVDPFNTTLLLIIPLHLNRVTSYVDVHYQAESHYPIVAKHENNFTAKEPPWDPSINDYSERET